MTEFIMLLRNRKEISRLRPLLRPRSCGNVGKEVASGISRLLIARRVSFGYKHIQRMFCEEHCTQRVFDRTVSPYWSVGAEEFIQRKVEQEAEYKDRLRKRFSGCELKG
jgi:hypothetical protein